MSKPRTIVGLANVARRAIQDQGVAASDRRYDTQEFLDAVERYENAVAQSQRSRMELDAIERQRDTLQQFAAEREEIDAKAQAQVLVLKDRYHNSVMRVNMLRKSIRSEILADMRKVDACVNPVAAIKDKAPNCQSAIDSLRQSQKRGDEKLTEIAGIIEDLLKKTTVSCPEGDLDLVSLCDQNDQDKRRKQLKEILGYDSLSAKLHTAREYVGEIQQAISAQQERQAEANALAAEHKERTEKQITAEEIQQTDYKSMAGDIRTELGRSDEQAQQGDTLESIIDQIGLYRSAVSVAKTEQEIRAAELLPLVEKMRQAWEAETEFAAPDRKSPLWAKHRKYESLITGQHYPFDQKTQSLVSSGK